MRPLGATRAFSPLGRETFITKVSWADDWPRMAPAELAPRGAIEETVFDFADASTLDDPGWLAVRTTPTDVASMTTRPGSLTIAGERSTLNAPRPQFIGRRQRHLTATVSTRVNASAGAGGPAARYDEEHHISIEAREQGEATVVTARAKVARIEQTWRPPCPRGR
jgi:xylan 1,4-beta-xylosidase